MRRQRSAGKKKKGGAQTARESVAARMSCALNTADLRDMGCFGYYRSSHNLELLEINLR